MRILFSLSVLFFSFSALAQFDSTAGEKYKDLNITRITPSGVDVYAGSQIAITFNRAVVPIGKMDREASEIPITIEPELKCNWRWIATTTLACNLNSEDRLKDATKYVVSISPGAGITAEDGTTIESTKIHEFITQRPKIYYAYFHYWKNPTFPTIRVNFNQPVSRDSVRKVISMGGHDKTINVKVEHTEKDRTGKFHSTWIIAPKDDLLSDAKYQYWIKPGLVSEYGSETGIEDRSFKEIETFGDFRFLNMTCRTNNHATETIHDLKIADSTGNSKCTPLSTVQLHFTAPVMGSALDKNIEIRPSSNSDNNVWSNYSRRSQDRMKTYSITIPGYYKAVTDYKIKFGAREKDSIFSWLSMVANDATMLRDEFGRPLENGAVELGFSTDHRIPKYNFPHTTSVLEKDTDSDLPVFVTNIDELSGSYDILTARKVASDQDFSITPAAVKDIAFATPFGVRKLLDNKSGILHGSFESIPNTRPNPTEFFTQITPFQVHAKIGHFNSLVWVTDMKTGVPVKNATVDIITDSLSGPSMFAHVKSSAISSEHGVANLKGLSEIDPDLDYLWGGGGYWNKKRLMVRIVKGDDIALLPLVYDMKINTYRISDGISSYARRKDDYVKLWSMTAQGVYRPGDEVEYKIYLRDQSNEGLSKASSIKSASMVIYDPTGEEVSKIKDIKFSEFGTFDGSFQTASTDKAGWYQGRVTVNFKNGETRTFYNILSVLVTDFEPAPFKTEVTVPQKIIKQGEALNVETRGILHSGGAYVDANTTVIANLNPSYDITDDPIASKFDFSSVHSLGDGDNYNNTRSVLYESGTLDDKGLLVKEETVNEDYIYKGHISIESTIMDDRGKSVAGFASAKYLSRDRFVGTKDTKWYYGQNKDAVVEYIVVDDQGNPVSDTDVNIDIEYHQRTVSKAKTGGNVYHPIYNYSWVKESSCEGESDKDEAQKCIFKPKNSGSYRLKVTAKDTKDREYVHYHHTYVSGSSYTLWNTGSSNKLEIIPEKTDYKVGDVAKFMVKNPYPGAKAIITIERYGILHSEAKTFDESIEIIEIPVKPDYVPGFYMSVVVTSPRVDKPLKDGVIDLGKPTFKIGYVKMEIEDPYKRIDVKVTSDKPVYKPREKVKVKLNAKSRHDDVIGADKPIELAVVVLDESVLALIQGGTTKYDPYKGFYSLESLDIQNYNLLKALVGRRKFEKKGANPGGDGGMDLQIRNFFKFVTYWNPSIIVQPGEETEIEFEVPDNLTGWRVLALAVNQDDLMGLGQDSFKVNRETEIRPNMPNQVLEGDLFNAGMTVMNRTHKFRKLKVEIEAEGDVEDNLYCIGGKCHMDVVVNVGPFKRQQTFLQLKAKSGKSGNIKFQAKAYDKSDGDAYAHELKINRYNVLQTAANYGTTVSDKVTESIKYPDGIYPDLGGLTVTLSSTVIGNVKGAFEYMKRYPYICWEQQISKATMASHYVNLQKYLPKDFTWEDADTLPQTTLKRAKSYQAPNGGMTYYKSEDRYVSPYLSAYTALAFNWLRDSGYDVPTKVEDKLHDYLKGYLRKLPNDENIHRRNNSYSIRAVALAALAEHGKVTTEDIKRYEDAMPNMNLFGRSHYLMAAIKVGNSQKVAKKTADAILAHSNQTGGKFGFTEKVGSYDYQMLSSNLRSHCAIISALATLEQQSWGHGVVSDATFKSVRSLTQRQSMRDYFGNTQENLYCMNALIDYARLYEKDTPNMAINVGITKPVEEALGSASLTSFQDEPIKIDRPMEAEHVGQKAELQIDRTGEGRLYYVTRMQYAPLAKNAERINAGLDVRREYSVKRDGKWHLLKTGDNFNRGDLIRVDIFLSAPGPRNFVVVDDAVLGGLEPVNEDLATSSRAQLSPASYVDSFDKNSYWHTKDTWQNAGGWSDFYFTETRFDAVRFYSEYIGTGDYYLSYTAQAVATGTFNSMPVKAQEMYDLDVYGHGIPGNFKIGEK